MEHCYVVLRGNERNSLWAAVVPPKCNPNVSNPSVNGVVEASPFLDGLDPWKPLLQGKGNKWIVCFWKLGGSLMASME